VVKKGNPRGGPVNILDKRVPSMTRCRRSLEGEGRASPTKLIWKKILFSRKDVVVKDALRGGGVSLSIWPGDRGGGRQKGREEGGRENLIDKRRPLSIEGGLISVLGDKVEEKSSKE